jgi:hypothetical protein
MAWAATVSTKAALARRADADRRRFRRVIMEVLSGD